MKGVTLEPIPRDLRRVPAFAVKRWGSSFPTVKDGAPYKLPLTTRWFRLACCDCGLEHAIRLDRRGRWLVVRAARVKRKGRK